MAKKLHFDYEISPHGTITVVEHKPTTVPVRYTPITIRTLWLNDMEGHVFSIKLMDKRLIEVTAIDLSTFVYYDEKDSCRASSRPINFYIDNVGNILEEFDDC